MGQGLGEAMRHDVSKEFKKNQNRNILDEKSAFYNLKQENDFHKNSKSAVFLSE